MPTNLNLNDALIVEAVRLGRHSSKREAVDAALPEYISFLKRAEVVKRFGAVDFDERFDYRKARAAR